MTQEEYEELVRLANEIHRRTLEMDHYIEIPSWWSEEEGLQFVKPT